MSTPCVTARATVRAVEPRPMSRAISGRLAMQQKPACIRSCGLGLPNREDGAVERKPLAPMHRIGFVDYDTPKFLFGANFVVRLLRNQALFWWL